MGTPACEGWQVVECGSEPSCALGDGYRQEAHPQALERLSWGREASGFFDGGPEGVPVRAGAEGNLPLVSPKGTRYKFSAVR